MRRQATTSRVIPAGSSRRERLDPFALPVRFEQPDDAADERVCVVDLHRERVILRRAVSGIKMAVNLPVAAYRGIAIRIGQPTPDCPGAFAVVLDHVDPALSLTLYCAEHGSEIVAEWRSWGRALGMPLLVSESDSGVRELFERLGSVRVGSASARRARHASLKARRAMKPLRRRSSRIAPTRIYRGEREIIARN